MNRAVPMGIVAGAIACIFAAGAAQAAPASSGVLGKLTVSPQTSIQVDQVGWRKHSWRRNCVRRCMWRSGRSYHRCRHICRHRW